MTARGGLPGTARAREARLQGDASAFVRLIRETDSLTFPLLRLLLHVADLVIRPQGVEVVVSVDVVEGSDKLLCQLQKVSTWSRWEEGEIAYLVNSVLELGKPVGHCAGVLSIACLSQKIGAFDGLNRVTRMRSRVEWLWFWGGASRSLAPNRHFGPLAAPGEPQPTSTTASTSLTNVFELICLLSQGTDFSRTFSAILVQALIRQSYFQKYALAQSCCVKSHDRWHLDIFNFS